MSRERWIGFILIGVVAAALVVAGCGDQTSSPQSPGPIDQTPDLEDPLGGFTTEDELPAFGDLDLAGSGEVETPYEDRMAQDQEMVRWQNAPRDSVHTYAMTVLWGMMAEDPAVSTDPDAPSVPPTDWTGHLEVNRGGVILRATVAFERGDYIIRPRTDRRELAWVSHTTVSFDGLRLAVIRPFLNGETGEDDRFRIVLGSHEFEFAMDDLADLNFSEIVDDLGNKVAIRSFLIEPEICARGFVGGGWRLPETEGERGIFRGRWISRDGSLAGYVRGHFGTNNAGHKVFFGKYISLDGAFRGIVRGTWEITGDEPRTIGDERVPRLHGRFRGDWIDRDERIVGHVRGAWRSGRGMGGFFEGVWAAACF